MPALLSDRFSPSLSSHSLASSQPSLPPRSRPARRSLSLGFLLLLGVPVFAGSCTPCDPIAPVRPDPVPTAEVVKPTGPSVEDAARFMDETEAELRVIGTRHERLSFLANTFINHDTESLVAAADAESMEVLARRIKDSHRFDGVKLPPDLKRKFDNLRLSQVLAAPPEAAEREELAKIAAAMEAHYGKAKYCRMVTPPQPAQPQAQATTPGAPPPAPVAVAAPQPVQKCQSLDDLERTLKTSRSYDELLDAWGGWHEQAKALRGPYSRYVALANKGARDAGYSDVGALWRAKYDMPPDAFAADVERLWQQVQPLYKSLHCYTRMKLRQTYGARVPDSGPIPAHLLGNMWAQDWGNVWPLVAPAGKARSLDVAAALVRKKTTPQALVKYGENFFTSLGLDPLPDTFWQRSMFVRPRDRDVVCHASAWDITSRGDLRLKMCIELDADNFKTVHHELGHIYYYWYYRDQPLLFQSGANDGFHEGIGDTIALSITPQYLKKIGLLDQVNESPADDVAFLLRDALDRVSFLPFGKLIDQWRWQVFSGQTKPEDFNKAWWELRARYQGVAPAVTRTEDHFDPGAKYHIPANVPYMRYFLAHILQFQFHRALCQAAGHTGPLYKCSVYGNRAAGDKLKAVLAMGASHTWQEAMQTIAGTDQIDANALLEYYQPLQGWLDEQTKSQKCGW
ncbi:MAG TPA: M2 family metallopeptidase [Pseudomonadota bacterium]|nr:M2 family metallopeptidase [Pseudomonadota bacterium]